MTIRVNLMPLAVRRRIVLNRAVRLWLVVYLAAGVLLSLGYAFSWRHALQAAQSRDLYQTQYKPIEEKKRQILRNARRMEHLRTYEKLPLALVNEMPPLTVIGSLSSSVKNTNGQVFIETFEFRSPEPSHGGPVRRVVSLRGIGQDDAAITQFVDQLRAAGLFTQVELKSTLAKRVRELNVREYQIECLLP